MIQYFIKSLIFLGKSFLGNFYRHLATFYRSQCLEHRFLLLLLAILTLSFCARIHFKYLSLTIPICRFLFVWLNIKSTIIRYLHPTTGFKLTSFGCSSPFFLDPSNSSKSYWGAAIAQWIRLRLPSCRPGFESQAHHLCFHQFIKKLCNVEKTKINKKRPRLAHFFLKKVAVFYFTTQLNSLYLYFCKLRRRSMYGGLVTGEASWLKGREFEYLLSILYR